MRRILIFFLALLFLGGFSAQAQARKKSFTVVFKPETDLQLIQLMNTSFNLKVLKKNGSSYVYEVPVLKKQEQFTELFASLPGVLKTDPAPIYHVADHIHPQAVHLQPVATDVAVTPSFPENSGANASGLQPGTNIITPIPLDGGKQMIINFKPGTKLEVLAVFNRIYGTQTVKQVSFYKYRVQLPSGLNAGRAARIFKLFSEVTNVQRLYA